MKEFSEKELIKIYHQKVLNQELSLKEYSGKATKLESRPAKVMAELVGDPDYKKVMTPDLFQKVAKALFNLAYFVDLRGFGDQPGAKHWHRILDEIEKYPLVNWHLVTPLAQVHHDVWKRGVENGFMMGFLCEGANAETVAKMRDKDRFGNAMGNLEIIADEIESKKKGFLYFIVILEAGNHNELPEILKIAKKFRIPEVQVKTIAHIEQSGSIKEIIKAVNESIDFALENRIRITINDQEVVQELDPQKIARAAGVPYETHQNFPPPVKLDREFSQIHQWWPLDTKVRDQSKVSVYQRCFKPFHYVHVDPTGKIGACNHLKVPEILEMGDLNKDSFSNIWNNKKFETHRQNLLKRTPTDPRCQWCFKNRLED